MVGRVQVVHTLRPEVIPLLAIDPGKILTAVHKTQPDKSVNVVRLGLFFFFFCFILCCFPSSSVVKNLPSMQETQETWVWSLGEEDPLEKGMATHSRILACRIPWTEEPGGLQPMGSQRVGHNWVTKHIVPAPRQLTLEKCRLWRSCFLAMDNLPVTWQPALPLLSFTLQIQLDHAVLQ